MGPEVGVEFSWTERQLERREQARQFAGRELADREPTGGPSAFDWEGWRCCSNFGLQGLPIPEQYGGAGEDILTTVLMLEALGQSCSAHGLLFAVQAHLWGCSIPLLHFGTTHQKEAHLTRLAQGRAVGALAAAEPEAGSDVYGLSTRAEKSGGRYILNGRKTFVTNGPIADLFLVLARLGPDPGWQGLSAFLVEKNAEGLSTGPVLEKMGLEGAQMSQVILQDCPVPGENLLGSEGTGAAVFNLAMEWERSFILSSAVGSMQRLLERCTRYSTQRVQFGRPIGDFQLVSTKLVDMKLRLETCRLLLYQTAWLKAAGRSAHLESSLVKLHISESWIQSCLDAIQIHGGSGYLVENQLERELRDAVGSRLYSGTSEIQRVLVARLLQNS